MSSGTQNSVTVLCLGDVVGRPGRGALTRGLPALREEHNVDLVIANGENAAGGTGLDPGTAREIFEAGVDIITLGDHTWQKKDLHSLLDSDQRLVRPANYPAGAPGRGFTSVTRKGIKIGIFNLIGRVFMSQLVNCPFDAAEEIVDYHLKDCAIRIGDMHAEATSEKYALGRLLDGRVSLLFGTHTHVQTADETILPGGTAFISDLGMTGPDGGVIGMDAEVALKRFRTGMPHAYKIGQGDGVICGIVAELTSDGKAAKITRVRRREASTQQ